MDIDSPNAERARLDELIADQSAFFDRFGALDEGVYADGAIPKRYKELTGLSISVLTRCEECVLYHVQGAQEAGADPTQLVEAIRIGVIGGGSITYPTARYAFAVLEKLSVLDDQSAE